MILPRDTARRARATFQAISGTRFAGQPLPRRAGRRQDTTHVTRLAPYQLVAEHVALASRAARRLVVSAIFHVARAPIFRPH